MEGRSAGAIRKIVHSLIHFPRSRKEGAPGETGWQALLDENPDEHLELPADPRLTKLDDAIKRRYLQKLHPEDAVVEIFSENPEDFSPAVGLSLQTNLIRFRAEVRENGSVRLFVLPEDESRTREIVREIIEGKPPE